MTDLAWLAGPSALVAALATVLGAALLVLFFAKGGLWGPLNDVASIVLMLATIPVALFLAGWSSARVGAPVATGVAAVGVIGMLGASVAQGLLIARIRTYQQLLPWTLGFGALVGVWYVLVGLTGFVAGMPALPALLAVASGVSFVVLGYGFLRGNERHPLSITGGLVLVVTSTWFLAWVGVAAIASEALDL